MKEKDNYTSLSDRWTGRDETNNIWGLLLYSAGEDFYNIYQEDKDIEPKKIAEIDINRVNITNKSVISTLMRFFYVVIQIFGALFLNNFLKNFI